jgi:hypothetical protein
VAFLTDNAIFFITFLLIFVQTFYIYILPSLAGSTPTDASQQLNFFEEEWKKKKSD